MKLKAFPSGEGGPLAVDEEIAICIDSDLLIRHSFVVTPSPREKAFLRMCEHINFSPTAKSKLEFIDVFDMCKYIPNEDSAVKRLRRKILYSAVLRGKNTVRAVCAAGCLICSHKPKSVQNETQSLPQWGRGTACGG